jgi:hypothetical protein
VVVLHFVRALHLPLPPPIQLDLEPEHVVRWNEAYLCDLVKFAQMSLQDLLIDDLNKLEEVILIIDGASDKLNNHAGVGQVLSGEESTSPTSQESHFLW